MRLDSVVLGLDELNKVGLGRHAIQTRPAYKCMNYCLRLAT